MSRPHAGVSGRGGSSLPILLLALAFGAMVFLFATSWTAPGSPSNVWAAARELAVAGPLAGAWLLMAFGFGWPLRRWLGIAGTAAGAAQIGLGVAVALFVVNGLASAGLMTATAAWITLLAGSLLGVASLWSDRPACVPTSRLGLLATPALSILILASLSPPGWLWSSEFGGYDALSYHLELPKEWLVGGRLRPLPQCVYAFLPSFMESAYLQLMELRGGTTDAAFAAATSCQLLHALLAIAAAWCTGQAAAAWCGDTPAKPSRACAQAGPPVRTLGRPPRSIAAAIAAAIVLCTPWTVVVGSLAYNEMAVVLLLAAGMTLVAPVATSRVASRATAETVSNVTPASQGCTWLCRACAIGLLAGAACGAKLTAAGFAAIPLGLLLLWTLPVRRWAPAAIASIAIAAIVLSPWLVRNWLACGNPLFPFATSLLGTGHWTAEQAELFARGHASDLGIAAGLVRLWQQFFMYGLGANPAPGEPWQPQWAFTPWLAGLALTALLLRRPRPDRPHARQAGARLGAIIASQLAMWLLATHLQSRFLLPIVVPSAMLVGVAASRWVRSPATRTVAAACVAALSLAPALVYGRERGGAPSEAIGAAPQLAGAGPAGSAIEENPAHWLNHRLPPGSRVLLVGDAKPFWFRGAPASYRWQTTWDRGPMSEVLAAHPAQPDAQRAALRRQGFTHLLIDPAMLDRWRRSGWNDPLLVPEALRPLIDPPNRLVKRFAGGIVLVELAGEG